MQGMLTNYHGLKGRVNEIAAKAGAEVHDVPEVAALSSSGGTVAAAAGGKAAGGKAAGGAASKEAPKGPPAASTREAGKEVEATSPAGTAQGGAGRGPGEFGRVGNRVKMANSASDAVSKQSMGAADRREMQVRCTPDGHAARRPHYVPQGHVHAHTRAHRSQRARTPFAHLSPDSPQLTHGASLPLSSRPSSPNRRRASTD